MAISIRDGIVPWRYHSCLPIPRTVDEACEAVALIDWIAEDTGLSRGKTRRAITAGHVAVDGVVVVHDPDAMVSVRSVVTLDRDDEE